MIIKNSEYKQLVDIIRSAHVKNSNNFVAFIYEKDSQIYVASTTDTNVIFRLGKSEVPLGEKCFVLTTAFFDTRSLVKNEDIVLDFLEDCAQFRTFSAVFITARVARENEYKYLKFKRQHPIFGYSALVNTKDFVSLIKKHKNFLPAKKDTIEDVYRSIWLTSYSHTNSFEVQTLEGSNAIVSKFPIIENSLEDKSELFINQEAIKVIEKFKSEFIKIYAQEDFYVLNSDKVTIYLPKRKTPSLRVSDRMLKEVSQGKYNACLNVDLIRFSERVKFCSDLNEDFSNNFFVLKKISGKWFFRNASETDKSKKFDSFESIKSDTDSHGIAKDGTLAVLPYRTLDILKFYDSGLLYICDTWVVFKDDNSEDSVDMMQINKAVWEDLDDSEESTFIVTKEEIDWSDL